MRVKPGFINMCTELQRQDARVFMANCISLLPGTLAADLDDCRLHIHLLDMALDVEPELRRLERAVARVFPGSLEKDDR
jgi:multicomponent Na+:H+ antiporter subunit E